MHGGERGVRVKAPKQPAAAEPLKNQKCISYVQNVPNKLNYKS